MEGNWTRRSITYSISRFHGNRSSKDRGLPCILHPSISYTYCDNESVRETNAKVMRGLQPSVNFNSLRNYIKVNSLLKISGEKKNGGKGRGCQGDFGDLLPFPMWVEGRSEANQGCG